jgi:hypothetical protein
VKQHTVNKPVVVDSAKTTVTKPAQQARDASMQLPAGYEQLSLTSNQREKTFAVMERYAAQIRSLESMLNTAKTSREKEMSALLTPQQQAQLAKLKGENQVKPSANAGPAHTAATTVEPKSKINKVQTGKRDNATASTAPISKDQTVKKSLGPK